MANQREPGGAATKDRPKKHHEKRGRKPFNEPRCTVARWPSTCGQCGRAIAKGEHIYCVPAGSYEGAKQRVYCDAQACGPAHEWYVDRKSRFG